MTVFKLDAFSFKKCLLLGVELSLNTKILLRSVVLDLESRQLVIIVGGIRDDGGEGRRVVGAKGVRRGTGARNRGHDRRRWNTRLRTEVGRRTRGRLR